MQRLPILDIFKQSLALPFSRPVEFFKTIGLLIGVGIFAGVVSMIFMAVLGLSPAEGVSIPQELAAGNYGVLAHLVPMMLVFIFMIVMTTAYIFNFWVRAGAYGFEEARLRPLSAALSAAFVNGIKFLLIGLLIGVVGFVAISIFSALGLAKGFGDQLAMSVSQDMAAATRAGMLNQIISLVTGAVVYSFFSANLTQTALKSDEEGLSHPHVGDFAVVLILLYLVLLVPTTLAGLMGSMFGATILNLVLGIFIMFAIGVAHGIRYRLCKEQEVNA